MAIRARCNSTSRACGSAAGEGRRLELEVPIEPLELGGERYDGRARARCRSTLDVSRMTGGGYALRLRFDARAVAGPACAAWSRGAEVEVDAREVDLPGGGEELDSPYVEGDDARPRRLGPRRGRARAAGQVLCRPDCAGLCPVCAADLSEAGPDHHHEAEPDPRWAKLRELRLE